MYILRATDPYKKSLKKVIGIDETLKRKLKSTLKKLANDPKYPSLNSHKVGTKKYGERWSSWVTGDIRIIWDYDEEDQLVLLLLDIGGHSGTHKVYN